MRLVPLGSGSQGNATLVELGGMRILVDAGLSARQLERRLEAIGVAAGKVDAIFLTHEHGDHARGAERFSKKNGVPVFCSVETLQALDASPHHFASWEPLPDWGVEFGTVRIECFDVPHDAARPVGYLLFGEGLKVGIATDLGHVTTLVAERLKGCHVLMVESNHDPQLLRDGNYPWHLKQRVSGRTGHLSNEETARLLRYAVDESCRAVVLGHLSESNNTPGHARRAASLALRAGGADRVTMRIAQTRRPTPAIEL